MKVATDFFYQELSRRFPLRAGQTVLDYGCGPGFLVGNLKAAGIHVTGADINESFLEHNREAFPGLDFILISEDPSKLAGDLAGKQFDQIILLSIIQYFKSTDEVLRVVKFLKPYLKPDGKLIIADVLDEGTSSSKDAIGIFTQCLKRGRTIAFVRFILYLILSDYRQISKNNKLLLLPYESMKRIADDCSLLVAIEPGMTPHPTRRNYILRSSNG